MQDYLIWGVSFAATLTMQLLGLAMALALKTERFFDFCGAVNFLLLAAATWLLSDEILDARRIATTLLFCASRMWLLIFLSIRAGERGDTRFDAVKDSCLFAPYWIGQAVWVFLIAMPVTAINLSEGETPALNILDGFWLVLFFVCLVTQAHSDMVKRWWVKAGRSGHFCKRGCWNYSRHPNYFGEIFMAISAVGLVLPLMYRDGDWDGLAIASVLSPIFTSVIMLFGTGLPTAEGKALERYYKQAGPEYTAYRARTPILVPWLIPGYDKVPRAAKRLFCCEWSRYEAPGLGQDAKNTTAPVEAWVVTEDPIVPMYVADSDAEKVATAGDDAQKAAPDEETYEEDAYPAKRMPPSREVQDSLAINHDEEAGVEKDFKAELPLAAESMDAEPKNFQSVTVTEPKLENSSRNDKGCMCCAAG